HVAWHRWSDWAAFRAAQPAAARLWCVEQGAPRGYHEVSYGPDDYLVFGRETAGLPAPLLRQQGDSWVTIPQLNPEARSLNLSNCVAIVLFEALRQQGFDARS
ncbi:MAG: tRNA (cytidine(34)-2'-O)-methyltransferase, partial [Verrucomicrobiota bacterium]